MRKFIWIFVIFCVILNVNSAKEKTENEKPNENETRLSESSELINFGIRLYRRLSNEKKNLIFSPFSFRVLYSMIYQTAQNDLETQLRDLLYSTQMDGFNKSMVIKNQVKSFNKILKYDNIKFGNKIYLQEKYKLAPPLRRLATKYNSEVELVDFSKPAHIVRQMNIWAELKTGGHIKNMVSQHSVTKETALYIVNAIYFKARWLDPYAHYSLVHKPFRSADYERKSIPFIRDNGYYKMANLNEMKVDALQLPYDNDKFVFWILLPQLGSNTTELTKNLNRKMIREIGKKLNLVFCKIMFPVFEIVSNIDARKITPWIFNRRDLIMLEDAPPVGVDEIKQKTKIVVNQHGTESSSSHTKIPAHPGFTPGFEVIADRPFFFAVLTADRYEPVFMGHYVQA